MGTRSPAGGIGSPETGGGGAGRGGGGRERGEKEQDLELSLEQPQCSNRVGRHRKL